MWSDKEASKNHYNDTMDQLKDYLYAYYFAKENNDNNTLKSAVYKTVALTPVAYNENGIKECRERIDIFSLAPIYDKDIFENYIKKLLKNALS